MRHLNTGYLYSKGFTLDSWVSKPKLLPYGIWGIILFLNNPLRVQKNKWTISVYSRFEAIDSHSGFFLFIWIWHYKRMGYSKENIHVDKYDVDSVCYWSPYMNVN